MFYHHLGAAAEILPTANPCVVPHTAAVVDHAAANALALTLGRSFSPGEMAIIADHMARHAGGFDKEHGRLPEIAEAERTYSSASSFPDWTGHTIEKRLRLCAYLLSSLGHLRSPSFERIMREIDARVANERSRDLVGKEAENGLR